MPRFKNYTWKEKKNGKAVIRFFDQPVIVTELKIPQSFMQYISFISFLGYSIGNCDVFTVHGDKDSVVKALKKIVKDDLSKFFDARDYVIVADGEEREVSNIVSYLFSRYVVVILRLKEVYFVAGVKRK